MKKLIYKFVVILIVVSFLSNCTPPEASIEKKVWKYGHGFHIQDVLVFDDKVLQVVNDTIFRNGERIARLVKVEKQILEDDEQLTLVSLETNHRGIYHRK